MHLKVGVVSGITLKGTQKSAQALGENGQVRNFAVIVPVKDQQLKSSQTVDGGDQLTNQLAAHPTCSVHHQVGQLALPVGMLQKKDQNVNVIAVAVHKLQVGDGRENGDNLLNGVSVDQS
ncbi:hypothetical protein TYRP_015546 [Tyrophagus putrescentiae]|nr:hypothetical protein TYRP_015546 [Tyrophagus putrescentiae]